jgi:STAS domain-containing protein
MSFEARAGLPGEMTDHQEHQPADPGPGPAVMVLTGPIAPDLIPALCARARELLETSDGGPLVCDVRALSAPDAVTVEALARLQLTALRLGRRVKFREACGELRDLLLLMGLADVLPCSRPSGWEPLRQAEQREQPIRVEEEADPRYPTV